MRGLTGQDRTGHGRWYHLKVVPPPTDARDASPPQAARSARSEHVPHEYGEFCRVHCKHGNCVEECGTCHDSRLDTRSPPSLRIASSRP
jgi:hypothetical protein